MKYVALAFVVIAIGVVTFLTINKVSPVAWGWWGETNTDSGAALHAHDPVEYLENGSAVPGKAGISHTWGEAVWYFASNENKNRFAADPGAYAPQFGGFCAFAVSKGFTADADPEAWHVENGRLYLFADKNVRDSWVAAIPEGSLERSEENWATRR